MSDVDSPVHTVSAPQTRWSRVNFAEAFQGVQSPLGWTYLAESTERAVRLSFGAIGALRRREVPPPAAPDKKISDAFFGQVAGNVTTFHAIGEAIPGTSGDTVIEQMFGERRPSSRRRSRRQLANVARYPLVVAKMVAATTRAVRVMPGRRESHREWWRAATIESPPAGPAQATELLGVAVDKFIEIGVPHGVISMVGQAIAEQIEGLAETVWGSRERACDLMTGYGALEETELMSDIWAVAHDELCFDELVSRHGFHGPDEGNLGSRVWREDPAQAQRLVQRYRTSGVAHPRRREAAQRDRREAAERDLLSRLGPLRRIRARVVLRLGRRVIPMRELGKAGFLHSIDGARCAARALGASLAEAGFIDDPDDVFMLTYQELRAGISVPVQDIVGRRRADDRRHRGVALPTAWTGNPEPEPILDESTDGGAVWTELRGIGVVGEEVRGRARVALEAAEADLEPGDVLVCRTTDPSWTPLFAVAEALVIDTGGVMSHGAIVARELGVTCVINTKTGTRDIPDGATITVDGRTGLVRIVRDDTAGPSSQPSACGDGPEIGLDQYRSDG